MRIVARLPDARMQITIFENDGRYPVQFEQGGLTQIYRFRKGVGLRNWVDLRTQVDEGFRAAVLEQFVEMRKLHTQLRTRLSPLTDEADNGLPSII